MATELEYLGNDVKLCKAARGSTLQQEALERILGLTEDASG